MTNALIRPAWTPVTIAMMIIGFMVFWPLGLAMIAYIIWGDRLDQFKSDLNKATDGMTNAVKFKGGFARRAATGFDRTGNVAFDDWREAELTRIDEKRRELDNMRAEFDDYQRELRRAKDEEEFQRFMSDRKTQTSKVEAKSDQSDMPVSSGQIVSGA